MEHVELKGFMLGRRKRKYRDSKLYEIDIDTNTMIT